MANVPVVYWLCVAKVDGQIRVLRVKGTPDEAFTRPLVQQINKDMEILQFRKATREEISAEAAKVKADPNYVPSSMEEIARTPDQDETPAPA